MQYGGPGWLFDPNIHIREWDRSGAESAASPRIYTRPLTVDLALLCQGPMPLCGCQKEARKRPEAAFDDGILHYSRHILSPSKGCLRL